MLEKRILVVEDEPGISGLLVDLLNQQGYKAAAPLSFADAGAALANGDLDLLITDIRLNGLPGEALARRARDSAIPVLVVSGDTEAIQRLRGEQLRCVAKPFRVEELLKIVDELVGPGTAPPAA